ncbi:MAG: bifunctional riboflavin kinase/FAD synthetase [Rhodoglobus sp.]|nr:bifunctional riboflavin kinase/FAD synthetase [Rhodoglobus sp.]
MRLFRALAEVPADLGRTAVTVGKFDGVHGGHRAVIERLRSEAARRDLLAVVVTFDRNPLSVIRPESCPDALVSNEQKLRLLERTGLDATLMLTFDRAMSEMPAAEFVESVLVGALRARVVLAGADFRFGSRGAGDVAMLQELGRANDFEVVVLDDVAPQGERRVSSTWIRELLGEGRVREAADLLGSLPAIRSVVVHGEQRGRTLGYPTANLSPDLEGYVPADGVYAAWLSVDGERYPAAVSIGNNPTFEGVPEKQVEAHVLDENLDLYDHTVEIAFVDYIRGMRKFPGVDELVAQMRADEQRIRSVLGVPPRPGDEAPAA